MFFDLLAGQMEIPLRNENLAVMDLPLPGCHIKLQTLTGDLGVVVIELDRPLRCSILSRCLPEEFLCLQLDSGFAENDITSSFVDIVL